MDNVADLGIALVESRSFRNAKLSGVSQESALELLERAKALVATSWEGCQYCITSQVAEWYGVPEDTVQSAVKNNREELEMDGLKILKGSKLKGFKTNLSVVSGIDTAKITVVTVWTPKAVLRLAMFLRDSLQALAIRNLLLDIATKKPEQAKPKQILPTKSEAVEITASALRSAGVDPAHVELWRLALLTKVDPDNADVYEDGKRLLAGKAVIEERFVSPSEIGELVAQKLELPKAVSAIEINKTFNSLGLQVQTSETDSKGKTKKTWHLTDTGKQYAKIFTDTAKGHGKTVCVIRWSPKVVDLVAENLNR